MANTQRDGTDGRADDGSAVAPSPPGVSLGQGDEVVQGGARRRGVEPNP
jgi:hypothetical protein